MTYAALHENKTEYIWRRRKLRRDQTIAEKVLWRELRGRSMVYKWRRQCSIENFIADFCCFELRLIIELDGPVHEGRAKYDKNRENLLLQKGFKVIRYKNDEVIFRRESVLENITLNCQNRKKEINKIAALNLTPTPLLRGEG